MNNNTNNTVYILSEVNNNEIQQPTIYLDFSSALSEMYVRMASAFGYTESEIPEMLKDAKNIDSFNILVRDNEFATAWGDKHNGEEAYWAIHCVFDFSIPNPITKTVLIQITKDMVREGLNKEIIRIQPMNEKDTTLICAIGEYYFYFLNSDKECLSLTDYLATTTLEDRVNEIFETLDNFRLHPDVFGNEYAYYYYFLKEQGI